MKLLKSKLQETKEVEYFSLTLTVPKTVNYIATDEDGDVYGLSHKPHIYRNFWRRDDSDFYNSIEVWVATVDLEGMDFKDTLVKL